MVKKFYLKREGNDILMSQRLKDLVSSKFVGPKHVKYWITVGDLSRKILFPERTIKKLIKPGDVCILEITLGE